MRQQNRHIAIFALVGGLAAAVIISLTIRSRQQAPSFVMATPWACVGGCGAGGSGGAGGATAKWIGTNVTGGLLDVQEMYSSTATKKSMTNSLETRLSFHPTYTSILALTVPVLAKDGSMQPTTAADERTGVINNGMGDIRIDFQNAFGVSGEFSYDFTLSIPTGDYAMTVGTDKSPQYLPTNLQLGMGVYSLTLDLGYTVDIDKALLLVDAMYSHPFAVNFSGKNSYFPLYNNAEAWNLLSADQKNRFKYYFKPFGENDLGAYFPPSITLSGFYGTKELAGFVHSFGLMFSAPLGVSWIPGFDATTYNPTPDPDNQAWTATLCYGLEFSRPNFPVFVAAYVPIHSKTASATNAQAANPFDSKPMAQWNAPDFHDILHRWSVFIGTKTTLF
ncbi:MAG TPA: hypothetical protein VLX68_01835 [Chitinivibrionales bacterium]|nr:hypothetical protein [Chitinivibrionales bacterium]